MINFTHVRMIPMTPFMLRRVFLVIRSGIAIRMYYVIDSDPEQGSFSVPAF